MKSHTSILEVFELEICQFFKATHAQLESAKPEGAFSSTSGEKLSYRNRREVKPSTLEKLSFAKSVAAESAVGFGEA